MTIVSMYKATCYIVIEGTKVSNDFNQYSIYRSIRLRETHIIMHGSD